MKRVSSSMDACCYSVASRNSLQKKQKKAPVGSCFVTCLRCGEKISLREGVIVLSPFTRPKEAGRDLENLRKHCQYHHDDEGKFLFEISKTEDFVSNGRFWIHKHKQLEEKESQLAALSAIWHLVDSFLSSRPMKVPGPFMAQCRHHYYAWISFMAGSAPIQIPTYWKEFRQEAKMVDTDIQPHVIDEITTVVRSTIISLADQLPGEPDFETARFLSREYQEQLYQKIKSVLDKVESWQTLWSETHRKRFAGVIQLRLKSFCVLESEKCKTPVC